jgi:hypothetical protein
MSLKVYRSKTGVKYNILFQKKDGRQVQIEFRGSNKEYRTRDEEIQELIESGSYFTEKKIELCHTMAEDKLPENTPVDEVIYTNVTEVQEAVDILIKNHGAKAKDLKTPSSVKSVAKDHNVSFPNVEFNKS